MDVTLLLVHLGKFGFEKKKKKREMEKKNGIFERHLKKLNWTKLFFIYLKIYENILDRKKKKMKSIIDITSFDFYVFYLYLFKC